MAELEADDEEQQLLYRTNKAGYLEDHHGGWAAFSVVDVGLQFVGQRNRSMGSRIHLKSVNRLSRADIRVKRDFIVSFNVNAYVIMSWKYSINGSLPLVSANASITSIAIPRSSIYSPAFVSCKNGASLRRVTSKNGMKAFAICVNRAANHASGDGHWHDFQSAVSRSPESVCMSMSRYSLIVSPRISRSAQSTVQAC